MKKDNKINAVHHLREKIKSTGNLKAILIYLAIIFLLIISTILVYKRNQDKATPSPEVVQVPLPVVKEAEIKEAVLEKKTDSLETVMSSFDTRLTTLEQTVSQQQKVQQSPLKLIAAETLRGVLEGLIPLEKLKAFLQKNPEPWAQNLLNIINPILGKKSYFELEVLLVLSPPPQPLSLWERFKREVKLLVHIRKLDKNGDYNVGNLDDIQKALREHDIQKAIIAYESLPSQEKDQLSSWIQAARDRLLLESCLQRLLSELMEG